jgi:adenine phosphoribosyltransferase
MAADQVAELVRSRLRDVPDFPLPGVGFKDISPLLADPVAFGAAVDALAGLAAARDADLIAGVEARGFLVAAAVARAVNAGILAVRKVGKLPPPTVSISYELEYGRAEIEIAAGAVGGRRVFLVDDVLATGGTFAAAAELIQREGGSVTGLGVLVELGFLQGRQRLMEHDVAALLTL